MMHNKTCAYITYGGPCDCPRGEWMVCPACGETGDAEKCPDCGVGLEPARIGIERERVERMKEARRLSRELGEPW